jgi:hypothetical protein
MATLWIAARPEGAGKCHDPTASTWGRILNCAFVMEV